MAQRMNPMRLCITCEKSGALHLLEPGVMAGSPAICEMKFGRGLKF